MVVWNKIEGVESEGDNEWTVVTWGNKGICRGDIRCEAVSERTEGVMKPHVVLKKSQKKSREGRRRSENRGKSQKNREEVECEMYTDLWEIWDVTLIYSNLLSSKSKKIKKIKREKGRWDKMEKKKIKRRAGSICEKKLRKRKQKTKNRGIITSCSGSVNINDNRNKQEKVFDNWIGQPIRTVNDDDDWTVISMSDQWGRAVVVIGVKWCDNIITTAKIISTVFNSDR